MPVLVNMPLWTFMCAASAGAAIVPTIAFFLFSNGMIKHQRDSLGGALASLVIAILFWGLVWTVPLPRMMTALETFF
jgi:hypothetical protein